MLPFLEGLWCNITTRKIKSNFGVGPKIDIIAPSPFLSYNVCLPPSVNNN